MRINPSIYIILILVAATGRADMASDAYNTGQFALAVKHYQILSDAGDPIAQNNLGTMYMRGKGIDLDFDRARKLFKAAAKRYCLAFRGYHHRRPSRAIGAGVGLIPRCPTIVWGPLAKRA